MDDIKHSLIIEYKNGQPIELLDLTASLAALADQFKRFAAEEGGVASEARLYVHEIRPGSTVAELVAFAKTAIDMYEAIDDLGAFAPYIGELMQNILHLRPASKQMDKPTVKNIQKIIRPTAIDNRGNLNIFENHGSGNVNIINISPTDAAAIFHNADHLLNSEYPDEQRFTNEPMLLYQLRDAPPGKSGDFGIIDRFSDRHKKLFFAADELKDAILHDSPFEKVFWVDGVVKTAGGSVVAYQISALRDVTDRSD